MCVFRGYLTCFVFIGLLIRILVIDGGVGLAHTASCNRLVPERSVLQIIVFVYIFVFFDTIFWDLFWRRPTELGPVFFAHLETPNIFSICILTHKTILDISSSSLSRAPDGHFQKVCTFCSGWWGPGVGIWGGASPASSPKHQYLTNTLPAMCNMTEQTTHKSLQTGYNICHFLVQHFETLRTTMILYTN